MSRVRKREMKELFSLDEALDAGSWPVAQHYEVHRGTICPSDELEATATRPLTEPEVFLSFARLSANGAPSETEILNWVHAYGLLHRRMLDSTSPYLPDGRVNQEPMSVVRFREESSRAYRLLRVYELYRASDVEELRRRLTLVRHIPHGQRPPADDSGYWEVYIEHPRDDGLSAGRFVSAHEQISDEAILDDALRAVKHGVEPYLRGMWLVWGIHGRLAIRCPDLLSAMYFQFASRVNNKRRTDLCKGCGELFEKTRGDRDFCSDRCRKASKRKDHRQSPTEVAWDAATLRVVRAVGYSTTHYAGEGTTLCGLKVFGSKWNTADAGAEVSCRNCGRVAEKMRRLASRHDVT
jgi:hypothetical protein